MSRTTDVRDDRVEEFLRLLASNQRAILVYLTTLMPPAGDVDDVMQDTSIVLWKEFHQFESGTNFRAWACTIAFNQVRAWRKRQQRDRLVFSEQFLKALSDELMDHHSHYQDRLDALSGCVDKLPEHHRELVQHRYHAGRSIEEISSEVNRSVEAVYRMLSRIRASLHECVNLAARTAGGPSA